MTWFQKSEQGSSLRKMHPQASSIDLLCNEIQNQFDKNSSAKKLMLSS